MNSAFYVPSTVNINGRCAQFSLQERSFFVASSHTRDICENFARMFGMDGGTRKVWLGACPSITRDGRKVGGLRHHSINERSMMFSCSRMHAVLAHRNDVQLLVPVAPLSRHHELQFLFIKNRPLRYLPYL